MADKQIKLGMTYKDLIDAISSDGLTVNSPNDITYEGDISIKNGNPLPLPDIHTAVFPEIINEGEVWLLTKVIIKKVNSLKVDGVSVDPNSSPLLVNISDEKLWKFYFSSGSIIGSNIEYSVDLRFVFEQSLSSHRKTTRKLVQRVSALEEGGSDGATLDKIIYIDTCFSGMGGISIDDTGIRWSDEFEIKYSDTGTVSGDIYHAIPIVAGDNVTFTIESEKVVISATGGGSGLVLGEDEGTAYEGSKGRKLANDFSLLIQDVILPASTMLNDHETRITTLEEGGGSGGGGGLTKADVEAMFTPWDEETESETVFGQAVTAIAGPIVYNEVQSALGDELYYTVEQICQQMGYCTYNDVYDAISNSATIGMMQESVTTLKGRVNTLDERVTTLEKSGGGGGSSSDSGTKKKYWLESDMQNVFMALEMMATFAHIKVLFEPTDNSIVQNGVYMGSFSDLLLKANVNYIEIAEVAGSGFSNLRLERSNDPNNKGFFIKTTYNGTDYEANPLIVNTTLIEM
jgi:hypothetical protein